jgi:elongation factor G
MHAKTREPLEFAGAGSIVAVVGVKDSITGDTLCDPANQILLERMDFPEPVISMSIEPNTADDKRRLGEALVTIRREDPSFRSHFDDETGQTIIAGMGELHLEIIKNKLVRDMKVGVQVGKPRVSYREAIARSASYVRGKFVKQTGGRGQFGDVIINLEPYTKEQAEADGVEMTEGVVFANKTVGGTVPKECIGKIERQITVQHPVAEQRFDLRGAGRCHCRHEHTMPRQTVRDRLDERRCRTDFAD